MQTMGANGWIKYGWGDDLRDDWQSGDPLIIDTTNGNLPFAKMTLMDAAVDAVNQIVATHPPPYTLMCSGGVDSQAMINAWLNSGHPFTIVSIRYISDGQWFNTHDLESLFKITRLLKLPVTYYNFDVVDFLDNGGLQQVSNANDCHSPQICTYIKMSEFVESGTIMFSGNYISRVLGIHLNYTLLGLDRYAKSSHCHKSVIPFFLNYTPSLAYSLIDVKATPGYASNVAAAGFTVVSAKTKLTGFEKVKDFYDAHQAKVTLQLKKQFLHRDSRRVFDLLFRYALEKTKSAQVTSKVINKTLYGSSK